MLFKLKKYFRNPLFLYVFPVAIIFYITVSLLDTNTLSLNYITKYFYNSFEILYLERAVKEGYIFRLVSLGINILIIFSLTTFVLRKFIIKIFVEIWKFISRNIKMIKISESNRIVILTLIIFMSLGLKADIDRINKSGSVDLRSRVVGIRSVKEGYNPYYFKWKPGMSQKLYDPVDYIYKNYRQVSRLTVTPLWLLVMYPFSNIEFSVIRTLSFIFQYLILFLTSLLLLNIKFDIKNKAQVLFFIVLTTLSFSWRLHIDRGQVYVFYTFILSIFFAITLFSEKKNNIISGVLLSILVGLRPTFIIFILIFLIFRKTNIVKFSILSGLVLILLTSVFLGKDIWYQYYKAVSGNDRYVNLVSSTTDGMLIGEIEGVKNLDVTLQLPTGDSSIQNILRNFFGIETGPKNYKLIAIILCLFILCSILLFYLIRPVISNLHILIISSGTWLVFDMMMPIPRFSYQDVMIIPVIALMVYDSVGVRDFIIKRFGWVPTLGIVFQTSLINTESFIHQESSILVGQILLYSYLIIYSLSLVLKSKGYFSK